MESVTCIRRQRTQLLKENHMNAYLHNEQQSHNSSMPRGHGCSYTHTHSQKRQTFEMDWISLMGKEAGDMWKQAFFMESSNWSPTGISAGSAGVRDLCTWSAQGTWLILICLLIMPSLWIVPGLEGCCGLPQHLDKLKEWSGEWLMKLNPKYLKVMSMGRSENRHNYFLRRVRLQD